MAESLKHTGTLLIDAERTRQIEKGFDAEHDDDHEDGSIADAATGILIGMDNFETDNTWPVDLAIHVLKKYHGEPKRQLVIAGALIAAEIERLERVERRIRADEKMNQK